jgi:hypothetical protein
MGRACSTARGRSLAAALLLAAVFWTLAIGRLSEAATERPASATSAEAAVASSDTRPNGPEEAAAEPEEHGLPRNAVEIARPLGFPITNSMVVSWVVALGLIDMSTFRRRSTRSRHCCGSLPGPDPRRS